MCRLAAALLVVCLCITISSCARKAPVIREAPAPVSVEKLPAREKSDFLGHADPELRQRAAASLAADARKGPQTLRASVALTFMARLSLEKSPNIRRLILAELRDLARAAAVGSYLASLSDESPQVRIEAVGAIHSLNLPATFDALRSTALSDPSDRVRQRALSAYAALAEPAEARALLGKLAHDPSDTIAIAARQELRRLER